MPRSTAARVAVGALALQTVYGLVFAWGAVAPYLLRVEHWSPLLVGAVFSATPLGYGTGTVIGGRLADRISAVGLMRAGATLFAVGAAIALVFPSGLTFLVFYAGVALGLGGGLAITGGRAAGARAFPDRVGAVGGALTGSYALGAIVMLPVVAGLAGTIGWLGALRVTGAALGAVALGAVIVIPDLGPPERRPAAQDRVGTLPLLGRPAVWTGWLMEVSLAPLGAYAFVDLATYSRSLGQAAGVGVAALVAVAAANSFSRLGGGVLSDRTGVNPVLLFIAACDLAAAGLLWTRPGPPLLLAAAALAGLGLGGAAGVLSRLAAQSAPDAPNSAFGLLFAGYALGALAGPLLGAWAGGGALAWLVVGATAAGAPMLMALRHRLLRSG